MSSEEDVNCAEGTKECSGCRGTERCMGCRGSRGVEGVQKDAELLEDQQELTSPLAHFQS